MHRVSNFDILKLHDYYRGIAKCIPRDGASIGLEDYFDDQPLFLKFPCLYSFAKIKDISIQKHSWRMILLLSFRLPMSRATFNEFQDFQLTVHTLEDNRRNEDPKHQSHLLKLFSESIS